MATKITDSGQIKSRKRVKDHGEVFTNLREVKAMCDLVKDEIEREGSNVLEPACGTGNFLAEILERKLDAVCGGKLVDTADGMRRFVLAVASIYGVDILEDNVKQTRDRLLGIVVRHVFRWLYLSHYDMYVAIADCIRIITENIQHGDFLKDNLTFCFWCYDLENGDLRLRVKEKITKEQIAES